MLLQNKERQEVAKIGKQELIDRLLEKFPIEQATTTLGPGHDAAVISPTEPHLLTASKLMIENIHFDLTYFPLKHLGYKAVAATATDILAMNALPSQLVLNLAVSNRFSIEAIEDFMAGVNLCCQRYHIDLVGFDITTSQLGLIISTQVMGQASDKQLVKRTAVNENDLICVSGDLAAAYTGLLLLEREKKVFEVNPEMQPDFAGHEYVLERQLKPEPRTDIVEALRKEDIVPTGMIAVNNGLAAALLHLCRASHKGADVYENKLPIDVTTFNTLKDLKIVAASIALNGGEDYELLFTIAQKDYEKVQKMTGVTVIGFVKEEAAGVHLITTDDRQIALKAQEFSKSE